jgi:Zn finger protein HypA/HybF involved in hydrogenase expression
MAFKKKKESKKKKTRCLECGGKGSFDNGEVRCEHCKGTGKA